MKQMTAKYIDWGLGRWPFAISDRCEVVYCEHTDVTGKLD